MSQHRRPSWFSRYQVTHTFILFMFLLCEQELYERRIDKECLCNTTVICLLEFYYFYFVSAMANFIQFRRARRASTSSVYMQVRVMIIFGETKTTNLFLWLLSTLKVGVV